MMIKQCLAPLMPNVDRECITHHGPCDCHKAIIDELVDAVYAHERDMSRVKRAVAKKNGSSLR